MISFRREYQSLNVIEVNREALRHNFHLVQNAHPEALVAPVLKSNAYGHGLKLIGKWASEELKPPFLCVDSLFEAYELEKIGVKTPLLILGYTFPKNFTVRRRLTQFHFPVYDVETLEALHKHQPGAKIHIKIDTGMHRLGIVPNQVDDFIASLKKNNRVQVEGIYSHLSQADNPRKTTFTRKQIQVFKQVIARFEAAGFSFRWKHISASAGALPQLLPTDKKNPNFINDPEFNLIRLGLSFYGYTPYDGHPGGLAISQADRTPSRKKHPTSNIQHLTSNLQPALSLKSHLVQIKTIEQGSEVSYGGTFKAKKRIRIGVLPIGYYDGLNRKLSNRGEVLVDVSDPLNSKLKTPNPELRTPNPEPKTCRILGRICMNMFMIDLSNTPDARVGDTVEVIGANPNAPNSIEAIARLCDTISYEALLNLSETTRRVLV